ncbi:lytic murein transglycosylase [Saccharopolyspora sp. NPDC002578]
MAVRNTRPTARRRNRRRWRAATALTPTLLLVAASSTLLSLPPPTIRDGRAESAPDGGLYGASGHLPQTREPGTHVLDLAGRPQRMPGPPDDAPRGRLDIPEPMMAAYVGAADRLAGSHPGCGVHWSVLASIGRIESGHARGGEIDVNGTTLSAILGPRLSGGPGVAAIPDTDGGTLDGDPVWDRAVGAMQFIPGTWNKFAIDGNDDGELSPHNVHDAAATAGAYLCDGGGDLREPRALAEAVFRYNHSDDYVRTVLRWADAYAGGAFPLPLEPLPEVDGHDVLAGSRLPAAQSERPVAASPEAFGSGASALSPPSPAAPPEPTVDARPTWPGASAGPVDVEPWPGAAPPPASGETVPPGDADPVVPPGAQDPVPPQPPASEVPPSEGAPPVERPPSTEAPPEPHLPPADGAAPPVPPASEVPPEPGSSTTAPGSATTPPPGSQQPEPSGSQPVPPPPAGAVTPPSAEPSSQPSATSEPSESSASPSTEPSHLPGSVPPSQSGTSTQPSTPVATEPVAPVPCEITALDEGRFVPREQAETAGTRLEPGTTDPRTAVPGEVVFVESATSGPLEPCEIPAEFRPAS